METRHSKRGLNPVKKIVFGLTIVSAGVLLLLFNLGYLDNAYRHVVFSWQSLLIALGFVNLFSKDNWYTGIILLFIGGIFFTPLLTEIPFSVIDIAIPAAIILLGIFVSIKKISTSRCHPIEHFEEYDENKTFRTRSCNKEKDLDEINIFSGGRKVITDPVFGGGSILNIFGGLELDLRQTSLKNEITTIETLNIFGGLSLIVPPDWEIKTETISILGGFADKRTDVSASESNKKLLIKGVNLFGGGEFKTTNWMKS